MTTYAIHSYDRGRPAGYLTREAAGQISWPTAGGVHFCSDLDRAALYATPPSARNLNDLRARFAGRSFSRVRVAS